MTPRLRSSALLALVVLGLSACAVPPEAAEEPSNTEAQAELQAMEMGAQALARHPELLAGVDALEPRKVRLGDGVQHVFYQQMAGGVPVWGGELILHLDPGGDLVEVTDALVRRIGADPRPLWTEQEAIDLALAAVAARTDLSEPPLADLWFLPTASGPALAWRVRIVDIEGAVRPSAPVLFVDARDGQILDRYDDLQTYSLTDADHTTYDLDNRTSYSGAAVGDSSDTDLLTTHDAVQATLDRLSLLGRDSYDNRGTVAKAYGHYSRNYSNAFWSSGRMSFGDGDGRSSGYFGTLDVTAHEFGHGVTEYEANLQYSNESGALNEGSSDILGAVVQAAVEGAITDAVWDMGEDVVLGSGAIRYMDEPTADGVSRDHYAHRYTGSGDSGGVHYNSGIANHFFYLLTEGGQHHTSAYRSGYVITGIGMEAAYEIWYTALSSYMTRTTTFSGARTATESACASLAYSEAECHSVSLAWYEVGVGSDPGDYPADPGDGGADTGTVDTGTGGPTVECSTGTLYEGSLAGAGSSSSHPTGGALFMGSLTATLAGEAGTDFDLKLYTYKSGSWRYVRTEAGTASDVVLTQPKTGTYMVEVVSVTGAGAYALCLD